MKYYTQLIFLLVLNQVNSQGGGGGGAAAAAGGGGGGAAGTNVSGGVSCEEECKDSKNQDCVDECEHQRSSMLAIVLCCSLGIPLLLTVAVCYWTRVQASRKDRQERIRLRLANDNRTTEPLLLNLNEIVRSGNNFQQANWKFTFQQSSINYTINEFRWNFRPPIVPGQLEFIGSGGDFFGSWTCQGYLQFFEIGQIKLWMLKDYNDKIKAGQTENWQYLIYQGEYNHELKEFNGGWYYEKYAGSAKYSGQWQLKQEVLQIELKQ